MPAFDGRREINMTFDYIPKVNIEDHTTYNIESDSFYRFIDEFNIDSVKWSEPLNISASYFLRKRRITPRIPCSPQLCHN